MNRVLIVDDQPSSARVLVEALRDQHQLSVATSGPRALEIAAGGGIDLVLLDVVMPGMDGFEICRRLKSDDKTRPIPVIFVTALGEVDDETRGFDAGGVDYISKPISPPVVRARVRTHLELKETRDLLEEMALIDSLTGIANRRKFEAALDQEWRRALRNRHVLSIAIVDVDYFKKFNDRYGHARGDACLRQVARVIAGTCHRPGDLAARYGGEEFALVLPQTESEGARTVLAELLANVEKLSIEHLASSAAPIVTVSLGAVTVVPAEGGESSRCLESADEMLYEAKATGRRRGLHLENATGKKTPLILSNIEFGGIS